MRISWIFFVAAAMAGCGHGRPGLLVEMNGRRLEFEKFEAGKVPQGLEVSRFDAGSIQVQGDRPFEVNGISILCEGDDLIIGGRKMSIDREARSSS